MDRDALAPLKDQVILDDLIVDGSTCVGFDCVNGESFGFDTHRLKENNIRIHFNDTSSSASFPTRDWRIRINDTSNGGDNYFGIEDSDAGTVPFRVEADAGNHALYVDSGGEVGFGTNTPVVGLHHKDGNTPTLRLEQDGSSGFTAQTWDVAGNEAGFFIRDATNGSRLVFRIRPGANTSAIDIDGDGVGINNTAPDTELDVIGEVEIKGNGNTSATSSLDVKNSDDETVLFVRDDRFVGIGTNAPNSRLQVEGTDVNASVSVNIVGSNSFSGVRLRRNGITTGGMFSNSDNDLVFQAGNGVDVRGSFEANGDFVVDGNIVASSDKRLKTNVSKFAKGLDVVMALNPISYNYVQNKGVSYKDSKIGLFAQELQSLVPEMVSEIKKESLGENGEIIDHGTYLGVHENEIKYLLINAIKEQQAQIQDKDQRIISLENEMAELKSSLNAILDKLEGDSFGSIDPDHEEDLVLSADELPYLKQNVPNPYSAETSIEYFIPQASSTSQMFFYDQEGRLLKKHNLVNKGFGKLNLKTAELPSGTYMYTLVVDGKMVSSKKMSVQ